MLEGIDRDTFGFVHIFVTLRC